MSDAKHKALRYPKRITDQAAVEPDPGRMTQPNVGLQSSTVSYRVGNDWVDQGAACDQRAVPGCFLDPGQRARLTTSYQARVNAAMDAYTGALSALRVDELLQKEPEQVDWVFSVLLDVIGMIASHTLAKTARVLAGGHTDTIVDVITNADEVVASAQATHAELGAVMGLGLGKAKGEALASQRPAASDKKTASIAYLDLLGNSAGQMFEYMRENLIASASDSAIVLLFDSFKAAEHTPSKYKEEISGKLARFKKTKLSMMGEGKDELDNSKQRIPGDFRITQHTKAFWVNTPVGRRLALYSRPHDALGQRVHDTTGSSTSWMRDQTPAELTAEKMRDISGETFKFTEYVSPEFVDVAVQMHIAKWGDPPTEHALGLDEIAQMGNYLTYSKERR